jgi:hypothetical protein
MHTSAPITPAVPLSCLLKTRGGRRYATSQASWLIATG